jgi:tetratricopeptide (TPR) repeat protein
MVELYSLIKGLNAEECHLLKHSFKRYTGDSGSSLMGKLFDTIRTRPVNSLSDIQLLQALYRKKKDVAIGKLKSRLFQHILEALGSVSTLLKEDIFDVSDRQELRIRKKMYLFRVLYRKKNKADYVTLMHLLNEVIKEAKEYELYDVVLEALRHKVLIVRLRKGFKEVSELEEQIGYYTYAYTCLLRTYDIYYDLLTNIIHVQNKSSKQIRASFRANLKEIEAYIRDTGSAFITYIYKMIRLEELQREKKHAESIDVCLDLISLVKSKRFLYREERMGNIYDNISQCHVFNGDFSKAVKCVQKAQKFYSKNLRSYIASKEQEFHAAFYAGDYKNALLLVEYILNLSLDNIGEFSADRYLFLKSCAYFKLSRFRDSINICNTALELSKDKGRWDLGIRYIRIMNMIELKDLDQADHSLEALRKSLLRNSKNGFISARDKVILKAFREYRSSGFNSRPSASLAELIRQLAAPNTELSWEFYSHELFPIHEWIASRLETGRLKVAAHKQKR